MTRTGQDAIDAANAHVGIDMPEAGYCLQFTRECYDIPSYYGSAYDAWRYARAPHPGDRNAPEAVPVFFETPSQYDHVCIRTEGETVVSTFNEEVLKFANIGEIEEYFGSPEFGPARYLGWSEDLNTVTIYTPGQDASGEDFLSYLSYDEQRRVLAWADQGQVKIDQVRSVIDSVKAETDRLPTIHATVDRIDSGVQNNNNGINAILDLLNSISASSRRLILLVLLVVVLAAVIGLIVGVLTTPQQGAVVAAGGLVVGVFTATLTRLVQAP